MPRPRTPAAKAEVSGAAAKNPQRHKGRTAPKSGLLGEPSVWLTKPGALKAWHGFRRELPWLKESHRPIVEIASVLRGRLIDGEDIGVSAINQLRMCLAQMGATPADETKVHAPTDDEEDPTDAFFQ